MWSESHSSVLGVKTWWQPTLKSISVHYQSIVMHLSYHWVIYSSRRVVNTCLWVKNLCAGFFSSHPFSAWWHKMSFPCFRKSIMPSQTNIHKNFVVPYSARILTRRDRGPSRLSRQPVMSITFLSKQVVLWFRWSDECSHIFSLNTNSSAHGILTMRYNKMIKWGVYDRIIYSLVFFWYRSL